ncbi:MAG: hypothetical protein ACLFV4_07120 [Candidatus Hydrogenedentota bacterium]
MNNRREMATKIHPPQCPLKRGPSSGLALTELIGALFVLSVGVFGTLTLYYTGMDRMRAQQQEGMAMAVLHYEMEPVHAMNAEDLEAWSATETGAPGLQDLAEAKIERGMAERDGNLYEVWAVLRWRGAGGRLMERSLTTLVYAGEDRP